MESWHGYVVSKTRKNIYKSDVHFDDDLISDLDLFRIHQGMSYTKFSTWYKYSNLCNFDIGSEFC